MVSAGMPLAKWFCTCTAYFFCTIHFLACFTQMQTLSTILKLVRLNLKICSELTHDWCIPKYELLIDIISNSHWSASQNVLALRSQGLKQHSLYRENSVTLYMKYNNKAYLKYTWDLSTGISTLCQYFMWLSYCSIWMLYPCILHLVGLWTRQRISI